MKKLLIGTLFIGLASLGYSQSTKCAKEEVKLSDGTITPLNMDYIEKVGSDSTSIKVFTMEKEASRFNLRESPFFKNNKNSFEIQFAKKNGKIVAIYDRNGKIRSTQEVYKNLNLPPAVRNSLFKAHPGWTMVKNALVVSYHYNKGAKKMYTVKITKGDLKKKLKYDSDGTLL